MSDNSTKKSALEALETDLPERTVTQKTIDMTVGWAMKGYRTSVKCATGRIFTDEEFEARRKRIYGKPLPHIDTEY